MNKTSYHIYASDLRPLSHAKLILKVVITLFTL